MKNKIGHFCKFISSALLLTILILSASVIAFAKQTPDCESGNHMYSVTITKEPTESQDGERTYKCDICGYTYTTPIPARGHKWGEWITDKEPTCCENGHRYRVCTKYPDYPHKEEEIIPATGVHNYVGSITKAPTCEEDGIKTFSCTFCGSTYTEKLPAIGHNFGNWIVDIKPTNKKEGHQYRVCANDINHIEEKAIPVISRSAKFAGTGRFNSMDIVLLISFIGMMSGFGCAIYSDLRLIFWVNKRHKKFVEETSAEWYC